MWCQLTINEITECNWKPVCICLPHLSSYPKINQGNINVKDKTIKILVRYFKKYLQNFKLSKVTFNSIQKALRTEEINDVLYYTQIKNICSSEDITVVH